MPSPLKKWVRRLSVVFPEMPFIRREAFSQQIGPIMIKAAILCLAIAIDLTGCQSHPGPRPYPPVAPAEHSKGRNPDPLIPRIPQSDRTAARQLTSPLYANSWIAPQDIVLQGKALYEGHGTCVNCHGWDGTGNGPASLMVHPPPRDFTDCGFQSVRSDGELFWIIKNGSLGTDMASMIPVPISSEEEAWKIIAYLRQFCSSLRNNGLK